MAGSRNNGFQCGILFAASRVIFIRMAANILVVDDDPLNRDLICKVLRREGYKVVEACDGAIALEILQMLREGILSPRRFQIYQPRDTLPMGSRYYPTLTTARITTPPAQSGVGGS